MGFGAAPLGRLQSDQKKEGLRAVDVALDSGITFFDVSPFYGPNQAEEMLGYALQGKRDRVRICTKAGRFTETHFDFSPRAITQSFEDSLRRLQTDHVDVLLAHDIENGPPAQILGETVETLLRLREQGKCGAIGVSGYPLDVLRTVVESVPIDVVLSYCHYCLFNNHLMSELLPVAQEKGVVVINGSPLGMGLLSADGPPQWHSAPLALQEVSRQAAKLCSENGTSLARQALQFALCGQGIKTTLLGMDTVGMVRENVETLNLFPDEDMQRALKSLFEPVQGTTWHSGIDAWKDVASRQVGAHA